MPAAGVPSSRTQHNQIYGIVASNTLSDSTNLEPGVLVTVKQGGGTIDTQGSPNMRQKVMNEDLQNL